MDRRHAEFPLGLPHQGHISFFSVSLVAHVSMQDVATRPSSLDLLGHPWLRTACSQAEFKQLVRRLKAKALNDIV